MKKYIFILILSSFFTTSFCQIQKNDLRITYIANEGFLLSSATKKILIDALFSEGYGAFAVPSGNTISQMMNNTSPFDNIDLYFLTHYHKDHCDPVMVNDYLSKHKNLPFIASKPSLVFIHGNCINFILKKKQFYELTPEVNHTISKTINDVPVKAYGLEHLSFYIDSVNIEEDMFNTSYLFEMDGIKIFHSGDIKKDAFQNYLAENKKWNDSIDVAFLYYELLNSGEQDFDYIVKTLHPKYIIPMHIPPGQIEQFTQIVQQLRSKFKNILFFQNLMDSQVIHIKEN